MSVERLNTLRLRTFFLCKDIGWKQTFADIMTSVHNAVKGRCDVAVIKTVVTLHEKRHKGNSFMWN